MPPNAGSTPEFFSDQVRRAQRFYLDTYARANQPLTVVSGGCEHCQPDYRIDRPEFPFYSIEFVARGRGALTLAGRDHVLLPGRLFAYGPGVAHRIGTDPADLLVKYFVDFTGPSAPRMLRRYGPAPGHSVQSTAPETILRIFDDLIKNGQTDSPYTPQLCAAIVQQLILKIAETAVVEGVRTTAAFATYQTCREFIRNHCLTLRSLEEVADQCLMRLKMNAAAQQLQQPNALVKEVAYDLGFSDPFHFSRAFKKVFGISPNAFRRLR